MQKIKNRIRRCLIFSVIVSMIGGNLGNTGFAAAGDTRRMERGAVGPIEFQGDHITLDVEELDIAGAAAEALSKRVPADLDDSSLYHIDTGTYALNPNSDSWYELDIFSDSKNRDRNAVLQAAKERMEAQGGEIRAYVQGSEAAGAARSSDVDVAAYGRGYLLVPRKAALHAILPGISEKAHTEQGKDGVAGYTDVEKYTDLEMNIGLSDSYTKTEDDDESGAHLKTEDARLNGGGNIVFLYINHNLDRRLTFRLRKGKDEIGEQVQLASIRRAAGNILAGARRDSVSLRRASDSEAVHTLAANREELKALATTSELDAAGRAGERYQAESSAGGRETDQAESDREEANRAEANRAEADRAEGDQTEDDGLDAESLAGEGIASAGIVSFRLNELGAKEKYELTTLVDGKTIRVSADRAFPEGAKLLAVSVPLKVAEQILDAQSETAHLSAVFAYDIKIVVEGRKYELQDDSVRVSIENNEGLAAEALQLLHVKEDLMDNQGNLTQEKIGRIAQSVRSQNTETELLAPNTEGTETHFELNSFSTIIGATSRPQGTRLTKASVVYRNGSKVSEVNLLSGESRLDSVFYRGSLELQLEASFGAGKDKTIEVSIPEGLSFKGGAAATEVYKVEGTDDTLKQKITPDAQTDANKQGSTVLGIKQYDGTLTLKFKSTGEEHDASLVRLTIPFYPAWRADYDVNRWESGTLWFKDEISLAATGRAPLTVKQFINGGLADGYQLDAIKFTHDENKSYGTSWKSSLNPEIQSGGQMTGSDAYWVKPVPNGEQYTNRVAYKSYSITFLAPNGAVFEGFKNSNDAFYGSAYTRTESGMQTVNGYEVPAGYTGYTWTAQNTIISPKALNLHPVWSFPAAVFPVGSTAQISVADVKVRYYDRQYEDGVYEAFDTARFPSLTYRFVDSYEEVFSLVQYEDEHRYTDGYEADYNLSMGAPGFEHTQEREAGYFTLGNRGTRDSKEKQITITYDVKDKGYLGVTHQQIPVSVAGDHVVSDVKVKLWNSQTGEITDWMDVSYYKPASGDGEINLREIQTKLAQAPQGVHIFLKAVRFNIDTIPKASYLRNEASRNVHIKSDAYRFYAQVLSKKAVSKGRFGELESHMEIVNLRGNDAGSTRNEQDGSNSANTSITGRAVVALSGQSLILGNNLSFTPKPPNKFLTGTKDNLVKTYIHAHAWSTPNAQLIDAVYLISPFGEPYTDIQMHAGADSYGMVNREKPYWSQQNPQPSITEMAPSEQLLRVYPKARLYKLDFTGITDAQAQYDARLVSASTANRRTSQYTPMSTDTQYNGSWITFKYSPVLSDPAGDYHDLFWVKFKNDTDVPINYPDNDGHRTFNYADVYELEGSAENLRLGKLMGMSLIANEGLQVESSAKQENETEAFYRNYDADDASSIMGMYRDVNYKLTVKNMSSLPVKGLSVYWPVPKSGENWGAMMTPEGSFKFTMSLKNALRQVPEGFEVFYAKHATPTEQYETWDSANTWVPQDMTDGWSAEDWNQVNFVKMLWTGTQESPAVLNGAHYDAVFDLTLDTAKTTDKQMYTVNTWRPYFLRTYTNSASWVGGEAVAAMLTPGYLSGYVWEDRNYDGRMDEAEKKLSGVKVELYDISTNTPLLRSVKYTDENGLYRFDGLHDGTAVSGRSDNCRIVVTNPSAGSGATDTYIAFTRPGEDMKMQVDASHRTAWIDVTPSSSEKGNMHHAGLVRAIPATVSELRKEIQGAGSAQLDDIEFSFRLEGATGTEPMPLAEDGTQAAEAVRSVKRLKQAFGTMYFTQGGHYRYYIFEEPSASRLAEQFEYDSRVYILDISVEKSQQDGSWYASKSLSVRAANEADEAAVKADVLRFVNQFNRRAVTPSEVTIWKRLRGDTPPKPSGFQFIWQALPKASTLGADVAMPMPEGKQASEPLSYVIEGSGYARVATMSFAEPGIYVYRLSEVNLGEAHYVYDADWYELRYEVRSVEGVLELDRQILKNGKEPVNIRVLEFINEYHKPKSEPADKPRPDGKPNNQPKPNPGTNEGARPNRQAPGGVGSGGNPGRITKPVPPSGGEGLSGIQSKLPAAKAALPETQKAKQVRGIPKTGEALQKLELALLLVSGLCLAGSVLYHRRKKD